LEARIDHLTAQRCKAGADRGKRPEAACKARKGLRCEGFLTARPHRRLPATTADSPPGAKLAGGTLVDWRAEVADTILRSSWSAPASNDR
jgi:hypothetical protein